MHPLWSRHQGGFSFLVLTLPLIFLICSGGAKAEGRARFFYPHLSVPAATVRSGGLAFQSFPGANGLQTFLLNALDIGILSRLEAGTAPAFYFVEEHKYNFNAKLNLLKWDAFHFAVGGAKFAFRTASKLPNGTPAVVQNYELTYGMVAANLFFTDYLGLGVNVARPWIKADSPELTEAYSNLQKIEWFVDLSCRLSEHLAFTPGYGALRLETLNPISPVPLGYGATFTWTRQKSGLAARISFGAHHMPAIRDTRALFSFSI